MSMMPARTDAGGLTEPDERDVRVALDEIKAANEKLSNVEAKVRDSELRPIIYFAVMTELHAIACDCSQTRLAIADFRRFDCNHMQLQSEFRTELHV